MPGSMKFFRRLRQRDVNLEIPLGKDGELVKYYEFEDKALNGFESQNLKNKDQSKPQNKLKKIHELQARSLKEVLLIHLPIKQEIDYLTIDVEGQEYKILEFFDFEKYKPSWILTEIWNYSMIQESSSQVERLLKFNGYLPKAKTLNTVFTKESYEQISN
jgi:hypothetical protein